MLTFRHLAAAAVFCLLIPAARGEDRTTESFSRVFIHHDGSYTRSWKYTGKNEICEETYRVDDVRTRFAVFLLDNRGRIQKGAIYDGSKTRRVGTVEYGYDLKTERLVVQRTFDDRGRRVEEVWMPEAFDPIKYREFAKRGVRLRFNPFDEKAKPVADMKDVKLAMPAKESGGQKFEPGMLVGNQAPSEYEKDTKDLPHVEVPETIPTSAPPVDNGAAVIPSAPAPASPDPLPSRPSFFRKKGPASPPAAPPASPPVKKELAPAGPPQPAVPPPAVVPAGAEKVPPKKPATPPGTSAPKRTVPST